MFGGVMFTPDKFVGGDDPATVIRALLMREHDMQGGNMRLLTFIAALVKQGGGELRIEKETIAALPPRFGLHHRHDTTGAIVLTIVPITQEMVADAMGEKKDSSSDDSIFDDVGCPGCGVSITAENAGGYRTFCKSCVAGFPELPKDGRGYVIKVYAGDPPTFEWEPSTDDASN